MSGYYLNDLYKKKNDLGLNCIFTYGSGFELVIICYSIKSFCQN